MAIILVILLAISVKDVTSKQYEYTKSIKSCSIGSVSENDHVTCICTQKSIYRCTPKEKSNFTYNYQVNYVAGSDKTSCEPDRVYIRGIMTCICNKNGTWPHDKCVKALKSLPEDAVVKKKCEPNSYVKVDCNVCRCNDIGQIDSHHCTNNQCEPVEKVDHRRANERNKLYGDCECGNWYSLAPCQFCFCVNSNKLVCNTGTSFMTNDLYLKLGAYNLHICGKGLSKELRELEFNSQDSLRQGREIDTVDQRDAQTTSPKPSTSPRPSVLPMTTKSKIYTDVNTNQLNSENKITVNTENIVVDNTSSESDESKPEPDKAMQIKKDYKESTKLPYDYEEDYELTQEQTTNGKQNIFQGKVNKKQAYYQEQAVPVQKPINKREEFFQPMTSENHEDQAAEKRVLYRENNEESDEDAIVPSSRGLQIPVPEPVKLFQQDEAQTRESENPFTNLAFNMKLDLPKVLGQVFQLALRKSMVTIDPNKKCTPGTVDVLKCNTCFCMKNSKLVCTTKKCD